MEYDAFLSHNKADKDWVKLLGARLEGDGLVVFLDEWDVKGEALPAELIEVINSNSKHFVLVVSPESLISKWVNMEVNVAIARSPDNSDRFIIPVLRRGREYHPLLRHIPHLDFRQDRDFNRRHAELLAILKSDFEPTKRKPTIIPWTVPYGSNPNFTGRNEEMEALNRALEEEGGRFAITQTQRQAVTGEGGVGKTQLAVEYAWQYGGEYPGGVLWVSADAGVARGYALHVETLGLEIPENLPELEKARLVKEHLQLRAKSLLILDNVSDYSQIAGYIPVIGNCRVIVTTRRASCGNFCTLSMDILKPDASLELLLKEGKRKGLTEEEQQAAKKVCQLLGYLPLALEMAGRYLSYVHEITFSRYLMDLVDKGAIGHTSLNQFLEQRLANVNHVASVAATMDIAKTLWDKPLAKPLLNATAVFHPEGISARVLAETAGLNWEKKEVQVYEALALLGDFSILTREESGRFSIHRLRQEVIKSKLNKQNKNIRRAMEKRFAGYLAEWIEHEYGGRLNKLKIVKPEIPQLICAAQMSANNKLWPVAFDLNSSLGGYYRDIADYELALVYYDKCQRLLEESAPKDKERKGILLGNIGSVYNYMEQPKKALELHEQALSIEKEVYGERHSEIAIRLSDIAYSLYALGQYEKAIGLYEQALSIEKEVYGERHPVIATTSNNLGFVWIALGQYEKATKLHEYAMSIYEEVYGKKHPYIAISLNSLGSASFGLGQYEKAIELHERALTICREAYGERHPEVAITLENLGFTWCATGQYKKAIGLYEQALSIRKEVYGEKHAAIARVLDKLGEACKSLGRQNDAMEYFTMAYELSEETLGEDHPFTRKVKNKLGLKWLEK